MRNEDNIPICKDCKYLTQLSPFWCNHPEVQVFDPVTGYSPNTCQNARSGVFPVTGKCGPEGTLFEQAVPPPKRSFWDRFFGCK